jgi:hypothetical protein
MNRGLPTRWVLGTSIYFSLLSLGLTGCGAGESTNFQGSPRPPAQHKNNQDTNPVPDGSTYTFAAGSVKSETIEIETGFGLVRQMLTLEQAPKTEDRFTQMNRPINTESFTQGHDGDQGSETFAIAEAGLFDLLIVIDDSSSMSPYQDRLAEALPSILKYISNTNWQIAVTTTTTPCLNVSPAGTRILTRNQYEADPIQTESEFKSLIRIGEGGNSTERGIWAATEALAGNCNNKTNPWIREDSSRAVLLVTDEHNCGSAINEGCPDEPYKSAQYFYDNAPTNVTVNGLLLTEEPPAADPNDPNDPNHDCQGSGGYLNPPDPTEYLALIQATGGRVNDICRSDFSTVLEQMSQDVKDKINVQFELTYPPVANSLAIKIDGQNVSDFTLNGLTLTVLEDISADAEQLTATYNHSPVKKQANFKVNGSPDPDSLTVRINDHKVSPDRYFYDPFAKEVVFREKPQDRSRIEIDYRQNLPLDKKFKLTHDLLEGSLEVFINDQPTTDFSVNPSNKKVVFTTPPRDNAKIRLVYARPGDKVERYPVGNIETQRLEGYQVIDRETGAPINANLEDDELIFPLPEIRNNRQVVVAYDYDFSGDQLKFNLPLRRNLFRQTLSIDAGDDPSICTQDLKLQTEELSFTCADDSMEIIEVSYQYAEDYTNVFTLPIDYLGPKEWAVYVDGKPIDQFHVFDDSIVILKDFLPAGSEVKIDVKHQ